MNDGGKSGDGHKEGFKHIDNRSGYWANCKSVLKVSSTVVS